MSVVNVLEMIAEERARQDAKWGAQHHQPLRWNAILGEEVGEVTHEALELTAAEEYRLRDPEGNPWHPSTDELRRQNLLLKELVQVAAVAVAWIQDIVGDVPGGQQ